MQNGAKEREEYLRARTVGELYGLHHTTVLHAIDRIEKRSNRFQSSSGTEASGSLKSTIHPGFAIVRSSWKRVLSAHGPRIAETKGTPEVHSRKEVIN